MSTRDELAESLERNDPEGGTIPDEGEPEFSYWYPQADALIAEGWRKKPSEADLFSRDPDSALAAFVDSFNGDEAGDIDWVWALDGNTGYAMRGGNDVEAVFRKAAAAILALMDRGQ